jgi:hypothetical protein
MYDRFTVDRVCRRFFSIHIIITTTTATTIIIINLEQSQAVKNCNSRRIVSYDGLIMVRAGLPFFGGMISEKKWKFYLGVKTFRPSN